jgi:hypothetical protein
VRDAPVIVTSHRDMSMAISERFEMNNNSPFCDRR